MKVRCANLRTKMDYVAQAHTTEEGAAAEVSTSQKHFWCLRTMKPLGPDGAPADDSLCVAGRKCFVAEGEA